MLNQRPFQITLQMIGVFILGAGCMHILLGPNADLMLGAQVSAQSLADPGLDSQNRFYGAIFTLYGVLLIVISKELSRYATILRCLLWVFLFAGLVRFISVYQHGWPPPLISALFAAEVMITPALLVWFERLLRNSA